MWLTAMQMYWSKRNCLHKNESSNTGMAWNTNMAAVLLFWGANMAAVTSCKVGNWPSYLPRAILVGQPFMSDDGNYDHNYHFILLS